MHIFTRGMQRDGCLHGGRSGITIILTNAMLAGSQVTEHFCLLSNSFLVRPCCGLTQEIIRVPIWNSTALQCPNLKAVEASRDALALHRGRPAPRCRSIPAQTPQKGRGFKPKRVKDIFAGRWTRTGTEMAMRQLFFIWRALGTTWNRGPWTGGIIRKRK